MSVIFEGIGFIIILCGASAADSQSIIPTVVMMGIGVAMMAFGAMEEQRR